MTRHAAHFRFRRMDEDGRIPSNDTRALLFRGSHNIHFAADDRFRFFVDDGFPQKDGASDTQTLFFPERKIDELETAVIFCDLRFDFSCEGHSWDSSQEFDLGYVVVTP